MNLDLRETARAKLPGSLNSNRRLDQWLRILPEGVVEVSPGKVEIGQGIVTALAQIAAEELEVELSRVRMVRARTGSSPDEAVTSGSQSVQECGTALRHAGAEARALMVAAAAARWGVDAAALNVTDGVIGDPGSGRKLAYWELDSAALLDREASGLAPPKAAAAHCIVGTPVRRLDIPDKIFGVPRYVHDMSLPGMRYGRIVRPGAPGARLLSLDDAAARALPGVMVVRDGSFIGVVAEREEVALKAAALLAKGAAWSAGPGLPPADGLHDWLRAQPVETKVVDQKQPMPSQAAEVAREIGVRYTKPYLAHASIGPCCAIAQWNAGQLAVWSHSQGIYNLRSDLGLTFGIDKGAITVEHVEGAGCYGHNGADDVAIDAALVALQTEGRPVRLLWRREDEFSAEPLGSAMQVTVSAALNAAGRPVDWTTDIWSCAHNIRGTSPTTLARRELADPPPWPVPREMPPEMGGGASRNSLPLYDIAQKRALVHLIQSPPVRTSALRGLGALPNIFAIECFLDELAERAGRDPVAYRLALMVDPRARKVIETAAAMADWSNRFPGREGRGLGIGFGQYKNRSAYAAVVMEVEVDREVRLRRAWCAADGGLIINPDGARNQIEGGIIQAASMTLREQVRFNDSGVASTNWDLYPILRFSEIPEIETQLIDAREHPSLGMGECTMGPTAAAIGNAVAHALGARIRDMPLTRERIAEVLVQT